jgi:hypothetical protein
MRKYTLLVAALLAALLVGCGGATAPASDATKGPLEAAEETLSTQPDATDKPLPTAGSAAATDTPGAATGPAGPAECVAAEAEFPLQPGLPPITTEDNAEGPADASITLIEYSDFQ